jgi:UDP-N-acetylmuramyl pentapeptide synthase
MLTLAHFLQVLGSDEAMGQEPAPGLNDVAVTNVVTDSRDAVPGSLFVALPGEKVDGHDYVAAAFERGAVAARYGWSASHRAAACEECPEWMCWAPSRQRPPARSYAV